MAESWSSQARTVVADWQERAWGDLAVSMGLGWAPQRAFAAMSPAPVPDDLTSVERMRSGMGDDIVPQASWDSVEVTRNDYLNRYLVDPPTHYESRLLHSTLSHHLDFALEQLASTPWTLPYRPSSLHCPPET